MTEPGSRVRESKGCICLAVYRPRFDLLRTQIETIQAQTVGDWYCIAGIDGPDATTFEHLRELIHDDDRFAVHEYAENVGFYRNFERLLQSVPPDAAWIALADQDDEWFPQKLEMLLPALDTASLVVGEALLSTTGGAAGDRVMRRRIRSVTALMVDNQVTGSLAVIRADLLRVALPFPAATDLAFHDHWLALCALIADGVRTIDQPVQYYVQHAANVIGETGPTPIGARFALLRSKSKGDLGGMLEYLTAHRWGWRVSMAVSLHGRLRDAIPKSVPIERELVPFLRDRASWALVSHLVGAVVRREAPAMRAGALYAGALRSRGRQVERFAPPVDRSVRP